MYSIGQVSAKVGIKIPTLRYYEERGLVPALTRTEGQQRRYSDDDVARLKFIRHARQLGFSLAAIDGLFALNENKQGACVEVHEVALTHLSTVQDKIMLLRDLEKELQRIIDGCEAGHIDECYVITSLANHELCEVDHAEVSAI